MESFESPLTWRKSVLEWVASDFLFRLFCALFPMLDFKGRMELGAAPLRVSG